MKNKTVNVLVLVIDDNEMNLKLMRGIMDFAGYQMEAARSAEEGIAKAAQIKADLVLMDIQLPEMDGYEATKVLRENADYKAIPILAISGYNMAERAEELTDAGFDGYLQKPLTLQDVLAKIKAVLGTEAD